MPFSLLKQQINCSSNFFSIKIVNLLKIIFISSLMLFSVLEAEETAKKNTKITNIKNNPYFVQKIDDKYKTTKNNMFWLSVEINSVEFRKGCLSTALCHRPMFKLSQTMTLNSQTVMMSWPMEGGAETLLQKDILHPFISHWEFGDPEDISIGCQIAGTDPSFGFARVCDEATARRIFQEENVRQTVMKGVRNEESILQVPDPLESQNSKTIYVQMNGRCFNTTLSIQKHTERCPWCVDPNVDIKVVGENNEENNGQQNHLKGTNPDETGKTIQLQNILILVLSGVVVFSLSGLYCFFLIFGGLMRFFSFLKLSSE
ncbi:hypothetical protein Mgra_00001376 [Meloidogyne graminicola]|uniref:C2 domain-containing protein n=1 Tax=Meloidogyne graminicola TaxID=189291 RepID=A0A8T0A0U4_9BILA|nr:hypothetical protein Mgra_00001376 [Meloidogyne graminicola]KAF7639144.1 hypothetical protein Mgra_00001376 [Meloidogyne graminicola]